jgi:Ca2+-binding RTX toxin-like protein
LPGSPTPTVNSSSAIASLIYYSGLDPSLRLPYGVHLSPGTATLLGTSGADTMRTEYGFTTLLGGHGHDVFIGGSNTAGAEKLYGGRGDDLFHWSAGFNVVHGGQPELDYAADGTDSMDYSGAGTVTITLNRHWVPHKSPNYVAVLADGRDHLYSIERIQWNEMTDRIILGDGVHLVEDDVILEPGAAPRGAMGEPPAPASPLRSGRLIDESRDAAPVRTASDHVLPDHARDLELVDQARVGQGNALANRLAGNGADNILSGMQGDDTLYGGAGNDILIGGPGSDGYVHLAGDGDDTLVETDEAGTDVLILVGIAPHQVSLHRPWQRPDDVVLTLDSGGCLAISDFFKGPFFGIERIVFDLGPAWTREDVSRLAAAASPGDDHATPLCAAPRVPAAPGDRLEPAAAAPLDPGSSPWDGAPDADTVPPESDHWAGLDAVGGWLF